MEQDQIQLMNQMLNTSQFKALRKISEGSYGEIFEVMGTQDKRIYAFKALQLQQLKKMNKMHEAVIECSLLQKLNHPGIIKAYKVVQSEIYWGYMMDLCPHGNVSELIQKVNHSLPLLQKKKAIFKYYLGQILSALGYLHANQIIHRDMKLQNMVIASDLKIRIIDFGTAKISECPLLSKEQQQVIKQFREHQDTDLGPQINPRQSVVGSAEYLSPQGLTMSHSYKTDIWALGIILYRFYHNSLPFVGEAAFETYQQIMEKDPDIDQTLPPEIIEVIKACLTKEENDRPTVEQLKTYQFFKEMNIDTIFEQNPPITVEELTSNQEQISMKKNKNKILFEESMEKKMFFGNYKPRLLSLEIQDKTLIMAYKYVDTKKTKNEVPISINDYAQAISKTEFAVHTSDKAYHFRVANQALLNESVENINRIIQEFFGLDT